MFQDVNLYKFDILEKDQNQYLAKVILSNKIIDSMYKEALILQSEIANTYGFAKGAIPIYYVEATYKSNILEHLKNLLFSHCVMNFLYQSFYDKKILTIGYPQLFDVELEPNKDAEYKFLICKPIESIDDKWKKVNLKIPGRKNYKDIDKQVENFIKEETENRNNCNSHAIEKGDWVGFYFQLLDYNKNPIISDYKELLWVKISSEEGDKDLQDLFLGKKIGEQFLTNSNFLQDYISNSSSIKYNILVDIKYIIPNSYFSFDLFKHHFQLKNIKDLHLKFIEIFSFRNDISQRREIIDAVLRLLLKYYHINVPNEILERQKEIVIESVHENPDYNVYRTQSDFKDKVRLLAEKQLKETAILDAISYKENININDKDILGYLNLINRQRTKEFLYFKIPSVKFNGQEIPISNFIVKQYCLREKTLNHIINYLIRKNKNYEN